MLARHHVESAALLIVHHHAVGTQVDPFRLPILGNHRAPGTDVASPILLMPFGNGELQKVDVFSAFDIFQDRAALDILGWNIAGQALLFRRHPPQRLHQFGTAQIGGNTQHSS